MCLDSSLGKFGNMVHKSPNICLETTRPTFSLINRSIKLFNSSDLSTLIRQNGKKLLVYQFFIKK
ncbi:hypothetical protein BpHYR1_003045 [Brachionus plicatilis]|uniref:Uncharacterized protein n=1 Tax=Brachionus plicatilis TaxID=10195 RepID=A0A3M7R083_BRAPC|nr:hypothetical protein BpHYR1_003045 [Brachionus plicatilis]